MNKVNSVTGELDLDQLGVVLMHEHLYANNSGWWHCPVCVERMHLSTEKVNIEILSDLRMDPFVNKDNLVLDDISSVKKELKELKSLGCNTIVDPTNIGIGRNPLIIRDISEKTGINVILGSGFYLEPTHPEYVKDMTLHDVAELIEKEYIEGIDETGIKIGIIGEIGISKDFTNEESKVLKGAAIASSKLNIPLSIHLPGWERHGKRVVETCLSYNTDPKKIILCHMNPSFNDLDYQKELADKGVYIEYDMIGMDYYYADQSAQCPYDTENANAIKELIKEGYVNNILISQDVFIKMMLKSYGGNGYTYILKYFKKRLKDIGVSDKDFNEIISENPRRVFS